LRQLTDGVKQITHTATMLHGFGVLILILFDEFTSADVEVLADQAEKSTAEYGDVLYATYVARYSDFLGEPATEFVGRVVPPGMSDL
jgi:hypothetical protein